MIKDMQAFSFKSIFFPLLAIWMAANAATSSVAINPSAVKMYAYVACSDQRIYIVDIAENKVVQTSGVFNDMGTPTAIDLDRRQKILYVASDRGHWQEKYRPIIAIDVSESPIKITRAFDLIIKSSENQFGDIGAVYSLVVSPDGGSLYAMYGRKEYEKGTTVIDARSGQITGHLKFYIVKDTLFSPDGKTVANMWSHGSRVGNGSVDKAGREWSASVVVYDIDQNKEVSRTRIQNNRIMLQPPWGEIEGPYVAWAGTNIFNLYNRTNGSLISSVDLKKLTDLSVASRFPTVIDGGNKMAIPMSENGHNGFIVIVDLVKAVIISKVEVGQNPTNVVLCDLIPTEKMK